MKTKLSFVVVTTLTGLVLAFSSSSRAADPLDVLLALSREELLDSMRDLCRQYGATDGSSAMVTCVQKLDRDFQNAKLYKKAVADCDEIPAVTIIAQGISEETNMNDVGIAFRRGVAKVAPYRAECKEKAHRQIFGR